MAIGRGRSGPTIVVGAALAVFVVSSVLPIVHLLATTLGLDWSTYDAVLLDSRQRWLLFNTIVLGTGTALLGTAIGSFLGFVFARVPLPGKPLLRLIVGAPVLIPPYVIALAWVHAWSQDGVLATLFGSDLGNWIYSVPATILVLSLTLYPLSMLATEVALRRIDGRFEEAALIVASPRRVLWRVTLPLAAPLTGAAALITFVVAISEFGAPSLLQVRVYTTEVFTAFAALYDFGRAIVIAVPLLALCVAMTACGAWLTGGAPIASARSTGNSPVTFGQWRGAATTAVVLVAALAVVAPVMTLLLRAGGPTSITAAAVGSARAIINSLVWATIGATLVVSVALWLAYALARTTRRVRQVVRAALVVTFAVPSTIVGVALIGLWNRSGPLGALYGTEAMFVLVYLARLIPVAALIIAATMETVSVAQEEAAAVSGAGWLRSVRLIVLPQLRVGLTAAWVVVFVLAFGELGASILVAPPGEATLPIRVYTLIANAPPADVAALALLQIIAIFTPLTLLSAAFTIREVTWIHRRSR
jgi:iron(III) transport system permease protein